MTQTTPTRSPYGQDSSSKRPATDNRSRWLLVTVLTGQFMTLLDVFIVHVAAPTLRADLHASGAGLQLVLAGYTISYAVLLITGARLGARFGHGRVFLQGLVLFTAASLACGLASGTGQLIAFRFVQGAGAAVMVPQILSLIQRTFTGAARVRAISAFSAVISIGAVSGQIVGGVLVSADLFGTGWRPAFLVNVPIGIILLALGFRFLPREERTARTADRARGLDVAGLLLLAAAVCLFTVPLVLGQERDWPLWSWISLALSALMLAAFAAYEARLARSGGTPLISPLVLRAPGITLAIVRMMVVMAANAGLLFAVSLHLQNALEYSALRTGLTFGLTSVAFGAVSLTWRKLPERALRAAVPGGFALATVSYAALGWVLRDGGDGGVWLFVALVGCGLGLGIGYSPTLARALGSVRPQEAADASGLLTTVTQLGTLIGIATLGTLYLNRLEATGVSAEAFWATALALAGTAAVGAVAGLPRRGR